MTRYPNAHANQEENEEEINNTEEENQISLPNRNIYKAIISNIRSIYFQNCYEISENIKKCEMLFFLLFSWNKTWNIREPVKKSVENSTLGSYSLTPFSKKCRKFSIFFCFVVPTPKAKTFSKMALNNCILILYTIPDLLIWIYNYLNFFFIFYLICYCI